jgi:hypothetical protein
MAQRTISLCVAGLTGACLLLLPGRGLAQGTPSDNSSAPRAPHVHLSWVRDAEAAEACPDASQVQADVASRLGFSPFVAGDVSSASVEVLVTHSKALWQAAAVMRGADGALRGNRHVESAAADCHSLAAAAALAIALMIDPEAGIRPTPSPAAHAPVPAPAPESVAPTPLLARPPAPTQRRGPRGALAIGAAVAGGVLPKPAFGPVLRGELELRKRLSVVVAAQFLPEQRLTRAGADAWLGLSLASVGPCYRVELGQHWAVASCGSFLLGSLSLSIASPEAVQAGPRAWWGVACGLRLSMRAGALELTLGGDALAHLARHNYTVSRQQPTRTESLFTEPGAGVLGSLTTGVRF